MSISIRRLVRGRTAGVREFYAGARRASAFLRDRERRRRVTDAEPLIDIPWDRGFSIIPAGRLPEVGVAVEQARETLRRFDPEQRTNVKNRKRFLLNVLDPATLDLANPMMRVALHPGIVGAVARYLGIVPLLTAVSVFNSDTTEEAPKSSQLYHCDGDEVRQVKMFVYCTDVDEASGPLTLLEAATSRTIQRRTGYEYRGRLTDEQVRAAVPGLVEFPILGRTGTAVLADTSRCFHFGSRVAPNAPPRLVMMFQYSTPYSFMLPRRYQEAAPFRRLVRPDLAPLQRLVLGE